MSNQITAFFKGRSGVAESVYQYDYGMVLNLQDIELPTYFDCYFEVYGSDEAIPAVGTLNQVAIPNRCLETEGIVTVTIPLHTGQHDSEVEYVVRFRVIGRARPVDDGSVEEQSALARAIAWLQHPLENIDEIIINALDGIEGLDVHTHGNITNDGDITSTAAIANGDRLVIRDASASNLTTSSIQFGTSDKRFLRNDGRWAVPTRQYITIWTGVASSLTQSITLLDTIGNYDRIEIYGEDGLYGILPHGENSITIPSIKKYNDHLYAEWMTITFSASSATITSTRWSDAGGIAPSESYARITKIIGTV